MKNFLLSITTLLVIGISNAQQIKLKKGMVTIDGVERFQYKRSNGGVDLTLYDLNKTSEILFMTKNQNGTSGYLDDDYKQISFISQKIKVESATYSSYPNKWFLKKLINENVLDLEGNINAEKLDVFIMKYDENITNRTIR